MSERIQVTQVSLRIFNVERYSPAEGNIHVDVAGNTVSMDSSMDLDMLLGAAQEIKRIIRAPARRQEGRLSRRLN